MVKLIALSGKAGAGLFTSVSDEDYDSVCSYKWHYKDGYVLSTIKNKHYAMHRYLFKSDPRINDKNLVGGKEKGDLHFEVDMEQNDKEIDDNGIKTYVEAGAERVVRVM